MRTRNLLMAAGLVLAGSLVAGCTDVSALSGLTEFEADASGEMEFTGVVDSIGAAAWTIGGLIVDITPATEIEAGIQVGDLVKVHATLVDADSLAAREIARAEAGVPEDEPPAAPPAPGEEIEFVGAVVSLGLDSWAIGDRVVAITSATEIKGTIDVGTMVKVHALVESDGSLTAREIEPAEADDLEDQDDDADDSDDDEDLEFKGLVDSIDGETWVVAGVTFRVPAAALEDGPVAVGDFVEIHAFWADDGVLTALRVELDDDDGAEDNDRDDDEDDEDDDEHDDEDGDEDDEDHDNSGSGSDDD